MNTLFTFALEKEKTLTSHTSQTTHPKAQDSLAQLNHEVTHAMQWLIVQSRVSRAVGKAVGWQNNVVTNAVGEMSEEVHTAHTTR